MSAAPLRFRQFESLLAIGDFVLSCLYVYKYVYSEFSVLGLSISVPTYVPVKW